MSDIRLTGLERWLKDQDDIARLLYEAGIPELGIYWAEAKTEELAKGRRHAKVSWISETNPIRRTYLEVEVVGTKKKFSTADFEFFEPVRFKAPE
jgi:hypothetical protein